MLRGRLGDGRTAVWLAVAWFLVLPLAVYWRALGSDWFVFGTDTYSHDYIMHLYGWNTIRESGRMPLWCPYLFCGLPFVGSFALCPFHPSQLLYFIFPHNTAFTLQYVGAVWVAGAAFWWWARRLGCGMAVALWGGTAFALSGHFLTLTYAGHLQKMMALAWVPVALVAVRMMSARHAGAPARPAAEPVGPDAARAARALAALARWRGALPPAEAARGALLLAFAVAMQLLASHAQVAYGTLALCAAWMAAAAGARVWDARRRRGCAPLAVAGVAPEPLVRAVLRGALFAAAVALGVLLAAIQVFPGMEMAGVSNRAGGVEFAEAVETSYPPREVLEYVIPRVFGDSVRGTTMPYFGRWGERIVSDYLGACVVVLALAGLVLRRGRMRWFLAGAAGAGLLVGLGAHTPLYRVLYALVPGFGTFRSPGTFMFVTNVALLTLATLGLDALARARFAAGGGAAAAPAWRRALRHPLAAPGALAAVVAVCLLAAGWAASRNWGVNLLIATEGELRRWHAHRNVLRLALETGFAVAMVLLAMRAAAGSRVRLLARAGFAVVALGLLAGASLHFIRFAPLGDYMDFLHKQALYSTLRGEPARPLRLLEERGLKSDAILHDVGIPTGYHPVVLGRYAELAALLGYQSPRFGDLYALGYAHTYSAQPPAGTWTRLGQYGPEGVWKWAGEPRPWARSNARITEVQDPELIPSLLGQLPADAFITEPGTLEALGLRGGPQAPAARLKSWEPARIVMEHVGEERGIVPVAESHAPGWKAVNARGVRLPLVPLNIAMRGVVVPPGIGTVTMTYDPFSFRLGAFVSWLLVSLGVWRGARMLMRRRG